MSYAGFVNGETAGVLGGSLSYGGTAQGAVNAGSYTLTASGLTSGNYALTYAPGALTVAKAALTVTANDAGKTYDGLAYSGGNGVSYAGFVNGETAGVLGGSLSYGGTAQGAVNAGSYTLTASGLTSGNYALTYAPGALTVAKAELTIVGAQVASKIYDGAANAQIVGAGLQGAASGDLLTLSVSDARFSQSTVGTGLAVTANFALGGAAAGNYDLQTPGALSGDITARPLLVTALAQSRAYGTANPPLTYVLGGAGLLSGDSLTGGLSTTATTDSPGGNYAIGIGTLSAPANYALSFVGADLAVGAAPLKVAPSFYLPTLPTAASVTNPTVVNFTLPANDNAAVSVELLSGLTISAPSVIVRPSASGLTVTSCSNRNGAVQEGRAASDGAQCSVGGR